MTLNCRRQHIFVASEQRKNTPSIITDLIHREQCGTNSSLFKAGCLLHTKKTTFRSLLGGCTSIAVLGFTNDGEYLVVMNFEVNRLGGRRSVSLEFWPVVLPLWRTLECFHLHSFQRHGKSENGYAACELQPTLSLNITRKLDEQEADDDEEEDVDLFHGGGEDFSFSEGQEELPAVILLQSIDGDLLVVCSADGCIDHERSSCTGRYNHRYEIWNYRHLFGYMHSSQLNRWCRTFDNRNNNTDMEYSSSSSICIYDIEIGQHLVCIDAGGHLFFMRTGLQKEQGSKHQNLDPSDPDVPLPKSWDNYCPCHPSRKLKEGKWWEAFAMVQKHCFDGDERWSSASSLDIEELMHELIKPHFSSNIPTRVADYETRWISRPLLHNSSALLAFSVTLQAPLLPSHGNSNQLSAHYQRSEIMRGGGSIDFVLAIHYINGHVKVLYELFEPLSLIGDSIPDCANERVIKLQKKWSTTRMVLTATSRVLDNYPLLAGESLSRLDNKQLACAIVMD